MFGAVRAYFASPLDALFVRNDRRIHPAAIAARARKVASNRKDLLRCMVCVAGNILLLLFPKTLKTMGGAGFFCVLCCMVLPPNMSLTFFLLAASTLVFGLLFGWAWGAASIAAGLRARDQVLLQDAFKIVQQLGTAAGNSTFSNSALSANLDADFQRIIFEGTFLDPKSSAVLGVFLFIGTLFLGVVRAKMPLLMLFTIYGTVVMDVFASYGPLFPFAQYFLANNFLIPSSMFLAIAVVCTLLIFPRSLNAASCAIMTDDVFVSATELLTTFDGLERLAMDEGNVRAALERDLAAQKSEFIAALQSFFSSTLLVDFEISPGAINADDLRGLFPSLKAFAGRLIALTGVFEERSDVLRANESCDVRSRFVLSSQNRSTFDLRTLSQDVLAGVSEYMVAMNRSRWIGSQPSAAMWDEQALRISKLEEAVAVYRSYPRFGPEDGTNLMRAQLWALHSQHANVSFADALLRLARDVQDLQRRRPSRRYWMPRKLNTLLHILYKKKQHMPGVGDAGSTDEIEPIDEGQHVRHSRQPRPPKHGRRPDPEAKAPRNRVQAVISKGHRTILWLRSEEAIFGFKYATLSVLLWLPAVFQSSAYVVYTQKGLWALIMAQTAMSVYGGDQVIGSFLKIAATFFGALLGAVIWYIGSGRGNGSIPGLAVAFTVFLIPVVTLRLYGNPKFMQGHAFLGVTTVLVVGYGWIDTHLPTLGSAGKGIEVAWKRFVLVMIGIGASTVMMMLPYRSSRHVVRQTHGTVIRELALLFDFVTDAAVAADSRRRSHEDEKGVAADDSHDVLPKDETESGAQRPESNEFELDKDDSLRSRILSLYAKMRHLDEASLDAAWDLSYRGDFPSVEYAALAKPEVKILQSIAQLGFSLVKLGPEWRSKVVQTPFFRVDLLAAIASTFHMTALSLRTAQPLPYRMPVLKQIELPEWSELGLSHAELEDEATTAYASCLLSLDTIVRSVNELRVVVTRLVGTTESAPFCTNA